MASTGSPLPALHCQQAGVQPTLSFGLFSLFPILPPLVSQLLLLLPEPDPRGTADEQHQSLAEGEKRLGPASQGRATVSKTILQVGYSPSVTAFLLVIPRPANAVGGRNLRVGCKASVNVRGIKWGGAASWCGCTAVLKGLQVWWEMSLRTTDTMQVMGMLQEVLHHSCDTGTGGGFALLFSLAQRSQLAARFRALGKFCLASRKKDLFQGFVPFSAAVFSTPIV